MVLSGISEVQISKKLIQHSSNTASAFNQDGHSLEIDFETYGMCRFGYIVWGLFSLGNFIVDEVFPFLLGTGKHFTQHDAVYQEISEIHPQGICI